MHPDYQIFKLWPNGTTLLILTVSTLALLIGSNEAIVKQSASPSSSSPISLSSSSSSAQSQQRSDDLHQPQQQQSASSSNGNQAINAQPYLGSSVSLSSSQPSSSSSQSSSSPSSSGSLNNGPSSMSQGMPQGGGRNNMDYSASNANNMNPKNYLDSMTAAATSNDQSYQAAANSVNMALASSGIYGGSVPTSNGAGQQYNGNGNGNANPQQQQPQANAAQLNPLHYFYYPAKDNNAQMGKPNDMMMPGGYSPSGGANFADQIGGALGGSASQSQPDVAASNQDPTYLPQPNNMEPYGAPSGSQMGGNAASNQHNMQSHPYNDYSNGLQQSQPQSQMTNGPSGNGGVSFPSNSPGNGNGNNGASNDYMNLASSSHQAGQQGQQGQQQSSYQNLYNQLNDLSNFGNTGALSSPIASYLPSPTSQQQQPQVAPQQQPNQMHGQQHNSADLFSNAFGSNLAGFNSAASQLSPSAMPPQSTGGAGQPGASSGLFGSSLFGSSGQSQPQASGPSNSLFANQNYLSSFMSPQQAASYASALANGLPGLSQSPSDQSVVSNQASPSSAVSGSSTSSKRFGISSFIMPMLALAGLSLLIPTMSNIGTAVGRKKRSIGEDRISSSNRQQQIVYDSMNGPHQVAKENSIGEYMDKIERYYAIYKNAVENDDCLNRLICEFGDTVKDVTGKSAVMAVLERLMPNWMTGKMHLFKEAAMDNRDGKEKCKKYVCNTNKHH